MRITPKKLCFILGLHDDDAEDYVIEACGRKFTLNEENIKKAIDILIDYGLITEQNHFNIIDALSQNITSQETSKIEKLFTDAWNYRGCSALISTAHEAKRKCIVDYLTSSTHYIEKAIINLSKDKYGKTTRKQKQNNQTRQKAAKAAKERKKSGV